MVELEASVAKKLYAGSRGRPAENFALLNKICNFCASFIVYQFLADRTIGRAFGTVCRLSSVCLSVTFCIVAKQCVLVNKMAIANAK